MIASLPLPSVFPFVAESPRPVYMQSPSDGPPLRVIQEEANISLSFNVMPDRPVQETLFIREYRVWDRYVEATFDRTYHSSMRASPSHLIFLTALAHTQKLLYVAICHEFGIPYDPNGPERFKMWPTKVEVKIPVMITQEQDLVQRLYIREIKKRDDKTYKLSIESRIGSLSITAQVPLFFLAE